MAYSNHSSGIEAVRSAHTCDDDAAGCPKRLLRLRVRPELQIEFNAVGNLESTAGQPLHLDVSEVRRQAPNGPNEGRPAGRGTCFNWRVIELALFS